VHLSSVGHHYSFHYIIAVIGLEKAACNRSSNAAANGK
jgi:hypothetical protein